jgi:hypothetical protein
MRILISFFLTLFLFSCVNDGLQKTDKKEVYTSNENVIFDNEKKMFKYEFSINNLTDKTITNFAYSIVFVNADNNAIHTYDKFFEGSVEPKKAMRTFIYIDDFTRKNYKSVSIFVKS